MSDFSPTAAWDDLAVGDRLPEFVDEPLSITDFVRYQGASGDMSRFHHDQQYAQRSGYNGVFAVGMLQAGVLANLLSDWIGPELLRKFRVQFREIAWPEDVLTYSAQVVQKHRQDGGEYVEIEGVVTRQTGAVHLIGRATFVAP